MKQFNFLTFNQDERSQSTDLYPTEKEAIRNLQAWAGSQLDDGYISGRLEQVFLDGKEFDGGEFEDAAIEQLRKAIKNTKESVTFWTTDGNYIDGTICEHEVGGCIVHGAQYDTQNGELRSFAKVCNSFPEAVKFVIDDYKKLAETYKTDAVVPDRKTLRKTKCAESPNTWPVWTKWTIETEL